MSASKKQSNTTRKRRKFDVLEALAVSQSKAIERIMVQQQELIAQQQATLDRIVTAQYDRPIERIVHPVSTDTMPEWGMNDQSSSVPSEIESGLAAMTVDSDAEFLAAVGVE